MCFLVSLFLLCRRKSGTFHSLTFTCYSWVFTAKGAVLDSFRYKWEYLNLLHNGPSSEWISTPVCLLRLGRRWFLAFLEINGCVRISLELCFLQLIWIWPSVQFSQIREWKGNPGLFCPVLSFQMRTGYRISLSSFSLSQWCIFLLRCNIKRLFKNLLFQSLKLFF